LPFHVFPFAVVLFFPDFKTRGPGFLCDRFMLGISIPLQPPLRHPRYTKLLDTTFFSRRLFFSFPEAVFSISTPAAFLIFNRPPGTHHNRIDSLHAPSKPKSLRISILFFFPCCFLVFSPVTAIIQPTYTTSKYGALYILLCAYLAPQPYTQHSRVKYWPLSVVNQTVL